ncbi:hypothetical protein [Vibrio gazogenes]|uniref:Uncharacterized protein n=1 Tax=Vibrio gazogenes DSM 21264 = NBRC 103151 TaxID=1123492 RepID=A0A1M5B4Z7_VIBGA|nr:hypothetical protein [Vibrio gazogenes]USP14138.1 hypothetical protein MKS89_01985 [Vibrio gazogenes]SHF37272.1 hypothetical protein SAMN02745781_02081 [Vibrio gazogenes DSM 21264] [Vibrio gazogenes DSM 21264 = NBRC 103151]SJN58855.1 hypothetical protein BQ6471_03217 [Vibrio gazogenes]
MRKQLSWFLLLPSIFSGYVMAKADNAPYLDQLLSADHAWLSKQVAPIDSAQHRAFVPMDLDLSDKASIQPQIGELKSLAEHVSAASTQSLQLSATTEDESDTVTPLCDTLEVGNLYTLSGVKKDGVYCYHFEVKQRSKIMALLVNQDETTDMRLSVLKHGANDQLLIVGTSDQPGNADEVVSAVVEPGHYYWYMEAKAAENASIQFGVSVNSSIDAYEPNDTPQTSTLLPETRNMIVGNIDLTTDSDYYLYTVNKGKKIDITIDQSASPGQWLFNSVVLSGSVEREENTYHYTATEGTQILIQVSHNPAKNVAPSKQYQILVGPSVASMSSSKVDGESNVIRLKLSETSMYPNILPNGPSGLYLTTQAYNQLTWQVKLIDSAGQPASNAAVVLQYDVNLFDGEWNPSNSIVYTDKTGTAKGTVTLGRKNCQNELFTRQVAYVYNSKVTYRTGFDAGLWRILVPGTSIGVGGSNVPGVTLGHICTQDVLKVE